MIVIECIHRNFRRESASASEYALNDIASVDTSIWIEEEIKKSRSQEFGRTAQNRISIQMNGTPSPLALLIALHFGLAKTRLCHMVNLREEGTRSSTG
jgi:hypothetical protein